MHLSIQLGIETKARNIASETHKDEITSIMSWPRLKPCSTSSFLVTSPHTYTSSTVVSLLLDANVFFDGSECASSYTDDVKTSSDPNFLS